MADSCIISKEQLSNRDMTLKSKLYGSNIYSQGTQSSINNQSNQSRVPLKNTNDWRSPTLYEEKNQKASPQKIIQHHQTMLQATTDKKMNDFLEDMQQKFRETSNANVIPQGILYQQTRIMDRQTSLIEENQKQMAEVLNNAMNSGMTGPNNPAALRQQVLSENRVQVLNMIAPVTQQLNEIKLIHESTKAYSQDMMAKMDQLSRVFAQSGQSDALYGNSSMNRQAYPGNSNFQGIDGMADPRVMMKGIENFRDEMKDLQRETILIENDMERRQQERILKNQQSRYLPQTITDEFLQHKEQLQAQGLTDKINSTFTIINQTREAVQYKLGGPFDYDLFREDLRVLMSDKDLLLREFKSNQLWTPEFSDKIMGGKIEYDFSTPQQSIFSKDIYEGLDSADQVKVQTQKPASYSQIQTEPKCIIDCDLSVLEKARPQPIQQKQQNLEIDYSSKRNEQQQQYQSNLSSKQDKTLNKSKQQQYGTATSKTQKQKQKTVSSDESFQLNQSQLSEQNKKDTKSKQQTNALKNTDILTLKKMVIEEIKSELQLQGGLTHQIRDPNKEMDQKYKSDSKDMEGLRMQGQKQPFDQLNDMQQQILQELQLSKVQAELEFERQKPQFKEGNQALTESFILNTMADMVMKDFNNQGNTTAAAPADVMKAVGEEFMMDKINRILDEVAQGQHDYEDSYSSQQMNFQRRGQNNNNGGGRQQPELMNTSVQVVESSLQDINNQNRRDNRQSQQRQSTMVNQLTEDAPIMPNQQVPQPYQQPYIVPIVINSNNSQNNTDQLFKNPNQLRDMISQAMSAQFQLHNIRNNNNADNNLRDSLISNDPLNQTSKTLQEEEAKNKIEQNLIRKQIPINVQPYIQQTIHQGPTKMQSYQNPFFFSAAGPNGDKNQQNIYGIQAPLLTDLDQFNLSSSSSSDFLSLEGSQFSANGGMFQPSSTSNKQGVSQRTTNRGGAANQKGQGRKSSKHNEGGRYSALSPGIDLRSEGEIGIDEQESNANESLGEIKFSKRGGGNHQPLTKQGSSLNQQQQQYENIKSNQSQLAQTINYEEEEFEEEEKIQAVDKPIYESSEGPIIKGKKDDSKARYDRGQGRGGKIQKSGTNMIMSGDSFGINPLRSGKGALVAESKTFDKKREKIQDNFLEEESDYQSSQGAISEESGELDPSLFR